ncbi:MAG: VPLPA-CTERM sorting domain-containing protein [Aliishimia sp.]
MKTFITAALMSLTALPALATVLEYNFTATLVSNESETGFGSIDNLVDEAVVAGTLSGTLSFSTGPGIIASDATSRSFAAPTITFNEIDTAAFEALPNVLFLTNDRGAPTFDSVVSGFPNIIAPGVVESLNFAFTDETQTAFSSLDFPALLDLAAFTDTQLNLFATVYDASGNFVDDASESAQFAFTSLTPSPVPLPAGGVLLFTGLGALSWGRRRQSTIKR